MAIGVDCGTYNLVCCQRNAEGDFVNKHEVNAFIEIPLENDFVFNMMKKTGVPLIERRDAGVAYALGEAAVDMAYAMNKAELKRPMKDGCLNPREKHAQQILSTMIHGLLDEINSPNEVLYYSVPANAINEETDADYHSKVLESIFNAFEDDQGRKVVAKPINEALALVYAEAQEQAYTALGCSFGSGMINVCLSIFGAPVFEFSIVHSGDWIDKMSAKATGETATFINKEKQKLDLTIEPDTLVLRAIKAQYEIMIQKTVTEIKKGLEKVGNKARTEKPVNIIVAGGTSKPNGFEKVLERTLKEANLSIEIGKVIKPADPLFSVARGCLLAAEAAT